MSISSLVVRLRPPRTPTPNLTDHYLNQSGCTTVDGMDDVEEFNLMREALGHMEFLPEEMESVFKTIAAILQLGNVVFDIDDDDNAVVVDKSPTGPSAIAADLFETDATLLQEALVTKTRSAMGQTIVSPLNEENANYARDALAKAAYGRMFDWIVRRINVSITSTTCKNFIGVLDIYGFEDLEVNGFEQLFINFANEKLQHMFNTHIFHMEEAEYQKEGIHFNRLDFPDNQPCLDLIEGLPMCILNLMEEECMMPGGSDKAFASKMCRKHKANKHFLLCGPSTPWRATDLDFAIRHYAGDIMYNCTGFVEKNRDTLLSGLGQSMADSRSVFIKNGLFGAGGKAGPGGPPPGNLGKKGNRGTMVMPAAGGRGGAG